MQPVLNETGNVPTAIPLEEPIFDIDGNGTNEFESNTSPEGVSPSKESDRKEKFNFPEGVSRQEGVTQPTEPVNDSAPIDIDWFSSCVDQYSMLLYQKLFFKCSTSLHDILSNVFLTVEPATSVQIKLIIPPIIDGFK